MGAPLEALTTAELGRRDGSGDTLSQQALADGLLHLRSVGRAAAEASLPRDVKSYAAALAGRVLQAPASLRPLEQPLLETCFELAVELGHSPLSLLRSIDESCAGRLFFQRFRAKVVSCLLDVPADGVEQAVDCIIAAASGRNDLPGAPLWRLLLVWVEQLERRRDKPSEPLVRAIDARLPPLLSRPAWPDPARTDGMLALARRLDGGSALSSNIGGRTFPSLMYHGWRGCLLLRALLALRMVRI